MPDDFNPEEWLEDFLIEVEEHLETFNKNLLELEKIVDKKLNQDPKPRVEEIFRAIHTIKGLSSMLGYEQLASLSHKIENLLDMLRNKTLPLTSQLIELLFSSHDFLKLSIAGIAEKNDQTLDPSKINGQLDSFLSASATPTSAPRKIGWELEPEIVAFLNEYQRERLVEAQTEDLQMFKINFSYDEHCFKQGLSFRQLLKKIQVIGEIIMVRPELDKLPPLDAFVPAAFDFPFLLLLLAGRGAGEIDEALDHLSVRSSRIMQLPEASVPSGEKEPLVRGVQITSSGSQAMRVDPRKLDELLNLAGELVTTKTRLIQLNQDLDSQFPHEEAVGSLSETVDRLSSLIEVLQDDIMKMRMVPIKNLFNLFPRAVRDLSKERGKEIKLLISGEETELDKKVIEAIEDPLVHLIRNAIDHGLEAPEIRTSSGKSQTGTISFNAFHEGNNVVIEVSDDGKGLDLDEIRSQAIKQGLVTETDVLSEKETISLVFKPGFSTAKEITEVSGRGVGLDVVKKNVTSLGGSIDVETQTGQGTKFFIKIPLTLAIIKALLVSVAGRLYAIPLVSVIEVLRAFPEEINIIQAQEVFNLRGSVLPLVRLRKLFNLSGDEENVRHFIIEIESDEQKLGLIVDSVVGQQEIVVKSLDQLLGDFPGVTASTILGNGQVVPILNVDYLIEIMEEGKKQLSMVGG